MRLRGEKRWRTIHKEIIYTLHSISRPRPGNPCSLTIHSYRARARAILRRGTHCRTPSNSPFYPKLETLSHRRLSIFFIFHVRRPRNGRRLLAVTHLGNVFLFTEQSSFQEFWIIGRKFANTEMEKLYFESSRNYIIDFCLITIFFKR